MTLRISLMKENIRRKKLSTEEYDQEAAIQEPCDRVNPCFIHNFIIIFFNLFQHPDNRYVL